MWQIIGGLLIVGAVIFFIQGYPGRAFVLLSPFLLFGLVVLVMAFFMSAKRNAELRKRKEAEAEEKRLDDVRRQQDIEEIRPLRERVMADIAVVEAAVARQRNLVTQKLAEARAAGAPKAKIDALAGCAGYLEWAFHVPDRDLLTQLPRLHFGTSSYYAQPQKVVQQDWSEGVVYHVFLDIDSSATWPARHFNDAAELVALALGAYADRVRYQWPQLIDELELSGYSAKSLPVPPSPRA